MREGVASDSRKEKFVPYMDALERQIQDWKAWNFKDRTVGNNHFNPSISEYCFNAADHKLSHTKNSCGTLSTLTNFIYFTVKKICPYVIFVFVYAAIQTTAVFHYWSLTRHSSGTPQLDWPQILRSFDSIRPFETNFCLQRLYPPCPTRILF